MRRSFAIALALGLALGCQSPEPEEARPAPAPVAPAPTPQTAPSPVEEVALAPADAPPSVVQVVELSDEDRLRRQIGHLRNLLAGELPADVETQTLFEVDIDSEEAVSLRLAELRGRLDTAPSADGSAEDEHIPAASTAQAADAGGLGDAGDIVLETPATLISIDAGVAASDAGPPLDAGLLPDAGLATALPEPTTTEGDALDRAPLDALEHERDTLRLEFLSLPAPQRQSIVVAARARRELAIAQADNAAALQQARADQERANAQRQHALDQAAASNSVAERALLAERARVEEARGQIAQVAARLAERRSQRTEMATTALELEHEIEQRLAPRDGAPDDEDYDALYDRVVNALRLARDALERGLSDLSASSEVHVRERQVDVDDPAYRARTLRDELLRAYDAYDLSIRETRSAEEDDRWSTVEALAERVRSLDLTRVRLLPTLSTRKRDAVLGLGPEGLAQLRRELRQARLMIWWEAKRFERVAPDAPGQLAVWFGASGTRWVLVFLATLLLGLVLLWRGRERVAERIGRALRDRQRSARWAALLAPWWGSLGAVFEPIVTLGAIYLMWQLAQSLGTSTALTVVARVALLFAGYRVVRTAAAEILASRLRAGERREVLRPRIQRDVRLVMGFGAIAWAVVAAAELLVGDGYLYSLIVDFALWASIPIVALLLYRWSPQVSTAYGERYPGTRLARSLGPDARPLARLTAVPVASARLLLDGSRSVLRELALRFEGSRRAVAFLFRRRLEKEKRSVTGSIEALPEALKQAFSSRREHIAPEEVVPDFFGMEPLAAAARRFPDGKQGTGIALVGERGAGKSTWARRLFDQAELEPSTHSVPSELRGAAATCHWLSSVLNLEPHDDVDSLCAALGHDAHRAVLLEDAQNLIIRAVGGTQAIRTLVEVIGRTSDRVFWVATFSELTWRYLERARQGQELFEHVVVLEGWSEKQIADLIRRRVTALGYTVSFEGLVVDRLEGTAFENAVVRSEEEFYRLLWDYSDGNPRVALHYFLRSIATLEGDVLKIQLFDAPDPGDLESLHEQSRFLLAAVALHENLTVAEAATATTFSRSDVAAILALLETRSVLESDENGRYRLRTHWFRAAMRYLRRKQLLFT